MKNLIKLLAIESSQIAWVLRLGLRGLRTQLSEALHNADSDAGSAVCSELLKELDLLLESNTVISEDAISGGGVSGDAISGGGVSGDVMSGGGVSGDAIYRVSTGVRVVSPNLQDVFEPISGELKLQYVAQKLKADRELSHYIGDYEFCSTSDGDLWNEIQRLLLRVPEKLAQIWRDRTLKLALEIGAIEDHRVYKQLPFNRCEIMYPGLMGSVKSTGLCLSNHVPISPQLVMENTSEDLEFLAGVVSTCLRFIQFDTSLHHALKSVDRFGIRSLNSEQERSKYATALLEKFRRVQTTSSSADPAISLRAKLDLDEAIHSLVYLPPCNRYSWWGKLQQESRRTIDNTVERARNAGYQVQIRPLWGTYADIYTCSKDDLQLDIGGVPGEVSACLRVYAKINDEILPGRVLFRSS